MNKLNMHDPLQDIAANVPDWLSRLDDLQNQISQRQIELAQLTEMEGPPTIRSLRNKGSTESLRPKDQHENPFLTQDEAREKQSTQNPFHTPVKEHAISTPTSPILADSPALMEAQSDGASRKQTSPTALAAQNIEQLQLQASKRLATLPQTGTSPGVSQSISRDGSPLLPSGFPNRKRKGSVDSDDTAVQKYRTRSMIIVYYDSAVQIAFEELVKFVASARNTMRKQKMADRMAEIRRIAELEADREEAMSNGGHEEVLTADPDEEDDDEDYTTPRLKFVSTRRMGPSMDGTRGGTMQNANRSMRRMMPSWKDNRLNIYEGLDKDLEFCQSMCEHAAHQFLRDGDCSEEIGSIKRRLVEVKEMSGKQIKQAEEEGEAVTESPGPWGTEAPRRAYRSTNMRKGLTPAAAAAAATTPALALMGTEALEADDALEIDDDEDANMPPPKLIFKSAR